MRLDEMSRQEEFKIQCLSPRIRDRNKPASKSLDPLTSLPAQEKFERGQFAPQTALRVNFFIALLRPHAITVAMSPGRGNRLGRGAPVSPRHRHVTAHPTSAHALRNRS